MNEAFRTRAGIPKQHVDFPDGVPAETEEAKAAKEEPFDPADHTVEEVKEHVEEHPEQAEEILEAELEGEDRSTLVPTLEKVAEESNADGPEGE